MNEPNKLHYTNLERVANDKYFSLAGSYVSFKENEGLWIRPQIVNLIHQALIIPNDNTYFSPQKSVCVCVFYKWRKCYAEMLNRYFIQLKK